MQQLRDREMEDSRSPVDCSRWRHHVPEETDGDQTKAGITRLDNYIEVTGV